MAVDRHHAPWATRTLGEIAERVRRPLSSPPRNVLMISSTQGFISQSEKYNRFMAGKSLDKYVELHDGEFAYNRGNSKSFPQGCVYRLDGWSSAAVPNVYISFRLTDAHVDPSFIQYFFSSGGHNAQLARVITSGARGNGLLNISAEDFFSLRIALPSLDEQRRIAAVLQTADGAVDAAQAVLDQTEQVKRALVGELLSRGMPGHHRRFKSTELGELPETWQVVLLDEVAERGSGHTPSKSHPEYWDGGIQWVSLKDSSKLDRVYISTTTARISALGIENSSAVLHPAGTVVLSRDAGVGKSAVTTVPMAVSQHFMAWRCGPRLHNLFLYYVLQKMKPEFDAASNGSTIKTIGLGYFRRMLIPLPAISEQQAIAETLLAHDEAVIAGEKAHERALNVRRALANELLTGRTRVSQ